MRSRDARSRRGVDGQGEARRLGWGLLGATALVVFAALMAACSSQDARPRGGASGPSVLLISIDSLRSDHLASSGYPRSTSPVLDRIAREGAAFPQTVANTSWTLPSHISMLTSLSTSVHRVSYGRALSPARRTLAEILEAEGYRTGAFVTGPWMTPAFGMDHGFEDFSNTSAFTEASFRDGDGARPAPDAHERSHEEITSPTIADGAIGWIDEVGDDPFFLFLHFWDVHYDYIPPAPYDQIYDADYQGSIDGRNFVRNPAVHPDMPPEDLDHILALYDGEIRYTDHHIGRVLAHLEAAGRLDDTIVIVTADHGEEFFEHGDKGHNKTLHDEVLLVPLLVRWPERVPAGTLVASQVRLIDILPTVADLVGIDPGPEAMGRSLAPLFAPGAILEGEAPAFCDLFLLPGYEFQALRHESVKTIAKYDGEQTRGAIFDLLRDPQELRPMPPRGADDPRWAEFEATRKALEDLARALPDSDGGGDVRLSPEIEAQLRALGYIE